MMLRPWRVDLMSPALSSSLRWKDAPVGLAPTEVARDPADIPDGPFRTSNRNMLSRCSWPRAASDLTACFLFIVKPFKYY